MTLSYFTTVSQADVWWVGCQRAHCGFLLAWTHPKDPKLNQCERPVTQTHMFQPLAGVGDVDRW